MMLLWNTLMGIKLVNISTVMFLPLLQCETLGESSWLQELFKSFQKLDFDFIDVIKVTDSW